VSPLFEATTASLLQPRWTAKQNFKTMGSLAAVNPTENLNASSKMKKNLKTRSNWKMVTRIIQSFLSTRQKKKCKQKDIKIHHEPKSQKFTLRDTKNTNCHILPTPTNLPQKKLNNNDFTN
jgi:hypothetical protein